MNPQVFEIRIDDECAKYYPGQVIEGRVILILHKEKAVRGIDVRLVGKGNVYWDSGIKHNHVFSESEVYVNSVFHLLVPEDGRQTVLQAGTYEWIFSIPLPTNIPSSLESQHCFIRYYLEAVIQRPWKDDQIEEALIQVTSISDLNRNPESSEPASIQKEKYVGFNICQTGPIIVNFMIGKTGFVPGEYLQFGVELRNTSGTRINRVHISLKRQITCHAKGETKSSNDKMLKLNGPSAEVAGYLLWLSNFEIPPIPPSELIGCNIISTQYYVELKLALEKWVDVKFNIPIIIGTIPLRDKNQLKSSQSFTCQETPKKSRKNSLAKVTSPTAVPEFKLNDIWAKEDEEKRGIVPPTEIDPFPSLPPLDLSFFQTKPERSPYFKYYEDCDCEFSYPCKITSSKSQEINQPPRPHSNPGHCWQRSVYWENEDD